MRFFKRKSKQQPDDVNSPGQHDQPQPRRRRASSISSLNIFKRQHAKVDAATPGQGLYKLRSNEVEDLQDELPRDLRASLQQSYSTRLSSDQASSPRDIVSCALPLDSDDGKHKWPFAKRRRGSMLSFKSAHEEPSFVLESFRTISRVQEDPLPMPLPRTRPHASSRPAFTAAEEETLLYARPNVSTDSLRAELRQRPVSPTISVNAFRQAQRLRSSSTASLLSVASSVSESGRPRFEPLRKGSSVSVIESVAPTSTTTPPVEPSPPATKGTPVVTTSAPAGDIELTDEMKMIALFGQHSPPSPSKVTLAPEPSQAPATAAAVQTVQPPKPTPPPRPVLSPLRLNVTPPTRPTKSAKRSPLKQVESVAPSIGRSAQEAWKDSDSESSKSSGDDVPLSQLNSAQLKQPMAFPLTLRSPALPPKKTAVSEHGPALQPRYSKRSMSALSLSTTARADLDMRRPTSSAAIPGAGRALDNARISNGSSKLSTVSSVWTRPGLSPSSSTGTLFSPPLSQLEREEKHRMSHRSFESSSLMSHQHQHWGRVPSRLASPSPLRSMSSRDDLSKSSRYPSTAPVRSVDAQDDDRPLATLRSYTPQPAMSPLSASHTLPFVPAAPQTAFAPMTTPMMMHPAHMSPYSQFAFAPVGVDPRLYASLPADQQLMLHQRANDMMFVMAQTAQLAKAQSELGISPARRSSAPLLR